MQTLFSAQKVNNEFELCEIDDLNVKSVIERELLKNQISFFVRWPKCSIFSKRKNVCIICVNESVVDAAADVISQVAGELGVEVRFLFRKSQMNFL